MCLQVKQRQEEEKKHLVALRDQLRPVVHTEQVSGTEAPAPWSVVCPAGGQCVCCSSAGHATQAGLLDAPADGRQTVRDGENRLPLQEE